MSPETVILLVLGAAAGGFVNGLAGFGTALFSLGFWLQVFPPLQAVAMGVVIAVVTGLQGLWIVRGNIGSNPARLGRFLVPALIGIPIGVISLGLVNARILQLVIAVFLLLYGAFFLLRGRLPKFEKRTPLSDIGIGFAGGVLGGLAGLSGALPAMWCAMRPWPRHETRAVLQPFNFVVLLVSAAMLATRGAYTATVLPALGIATVVALVAAQLGLLVFKLMSDTQFRWLLIGLMFVSGAALLMRVVWSG